MLMHNPPHPGEIIKELCLEPLGISITEAAKALGVSRKTLSSIINGKAGISPEMAVRLSIALLSTIYGKPSNIGKNCTLSAYRQRENTEHALRPTDKCFTVWRLPMFSPH